MEGELSRSVILRAVLVGAVAVTASCAQESGGENPFVVTNNDGGQGEQPETPDDLDDVVQSALDDVVRFWDETYPDVYGGQLAPISGGFHPYGPDSEPPPCGNPPPSYEEIADNAFYCPEDDLIAWDEVALIPSLAETFGNFTVGIVFAHEFGHAIQAPQRADVPLDTPTVILEQQADCFAGAWTAWIADGNSDAFKVTEDELDDSVAGMTAISDLAGTSAGDVMAHGSGFDRINAFQDGFEQGAERCAEYPDIELPLTEIPFQSEEDLANEGNMPLDQLIPGLESNLDLYYELLFKDSFGATWDPVQELNITDPRDDEISCNGETLSGGDLENASGYCPDENIVVIDGNLVAGLFDDIGDFAAAAEIARLYAQAAQVQLTGDVAEGKKGSLLTDCMTGVWAAANFPNGESGTTALEDAATTDADQDRVKLVLSAGDLDEAIQGFLTFSDSGDDTGTIFERVGALRAGFVSGIETCQSNYGSLD
jgi:predicted metalloprotease